ncbi:MAG: hypothetical protein U1C71_00170 [archaeon]|nr:hypothetical protein [archaeon]
MNSLPIAPAPPKAQVSMPDVLFATGLFLVIVVGLLGYMNDVQSQTQQSIARKGLDVVAANIAEFIIKNPGDPSNWEDISDLNQVKAFGLAQKDRVLDPDKVVAFVNLGNLDYAFTKTRLSVNPFEFYITFSGGPFLATGQAAPSSAHRSVVQRLATLNGKETLVEVTVYAT